MISLGLAMLLVASPGRAAPADTSGFVQRFWEAESFWSSSARRSFPETVGRFFGPEEYKGLRGNPVLGYWSNTGFRWRGKRIALLGIEGRTPRAQAIGGEAWATAFRHVAAEHGLVVDPKAPVRFGGACVEAQVDASGSAMAGVLLEVRVVSPEGILRYRLAEGKETIEDAMLTSLDFLLSFAKTAGEGE